MQKVLAQQLLSVRALTDYTAKQCTCYKSLERSTCAPLTRPMPPASQDPQVSIHSAHIAFTCTKMSQTKVAPMDDVPAPVASLKSLQCTSLQWMSLKQKDIHLSTLLILFSVMLLHMSHHWNHLNAITPMDVSPIERHPFEYLVDCIASDRVHCHAFYSLLQSGILVLFISLAILWNTIQCVPVYLHCLCNT